MTAEEQEVIRASEEHTGERVAGYRLTLPGLSEPPGDVQDLGLLDDIRTALQAL